MNKKRRPKARKSGTKPKKSKFLSLRLQFPPNETKETTRRPGGLRPKSAAITAAAATNSHHLDLPPLDPVTQVEEREVHEQENVAFFFSAADGGDTTLSGLLDTSAAVDSNSSHNHNDSSRVDYLSRSSASLTYASYGEERAALVRTAMRSRDRDSSEEKWVCYSEVVERKVIKEEEVTSSAVDLRPADGGAGIRRVALKLDYEEIINAWSDKGPLYIDGESSQIVPDLSHDHFLSHEPQFNNGMSWGYNGGGLWAVPEMAGEENKAGEETTMMMGQREASVLRYKEKRRNRLFSKQIRYQVRKLNAEKRPRLKGRFVKRS